jgi:two-component sensor histidine kinase
MARQTARYAGSTESFLEKFNARLQALAASHDILFKEEWQSASLADLVRLQLGPYLDRRESQVSVEGPTVLLKPDAAQNLGYALHELATNAAKYGALSVPEGRVSIAWRWLPEADGNGVELDWVESGGPAVVKPAHRGFGSMVIEGNLARELDTQVDLAAISHTTECIGAANQRKLLCRNNSSSIRGAPRCRQSVARISLNLNLLKAAR